jgi:hypothetical protein
MVRKRSAGNGAVRKRTTRHVVHTIILAITLTACVDSLGPANRFERPSLSVAANSPYSLVDDFASAPTRIVRYGVHGHPSAQPAYLAMPIAAQIAAVRGLAGQLYRMDVTLDDGGSANATGAVVENLLYAQEAIREAGARGMEVILVLTDLPRNTSDTAGMRLFGRTYANEIINQLILPSGVRIAAVELGNELEIRALPADGQKVGDLPSDYLPGTLYAIRNLYQGMREAFGSHPNPGIRGITRLLNGTQGHTHWLAAARQNFVKVRNRIVEQTVIAVTANSVDQVSWHWYRDVGNKYNLISLPFGPRQVSVLSQMRGILGSGNFALWITEFNRLDTYTVSGSCPNDNFGLASGSDLEAMLGDFASIPEVKTVIVHELIDQNTDDENIEARFGLTTYNCPNVAPGVFYKNSGNAFARKVLDLRDQRDLLSFAALELLVDGGQYYPTDSLTASNASVGVNSRTGVRLAVDNAVAKRLWVEALYRRIHRREADAGGLNFWVSQLGQTGWDRNKLTGEFYASDEYWYANGATNESFVIALYRDIQRREGYDGVAYWTWRLDTGSSRFEVARSFLGSPENISYVVDRAHQIALGRAASPAEVEFWLPQLFLTATYEEMVETLLRATELHDRLRERRLSMLRAF